MDDESPGRAMSDEIDVEDVEAYRWRLIRLLGRVSLYYVFLAAVIAALIWAYSPITDYLPVGGLGQIAGYDDPSLRELEEALLTADDEEVEEIVTAQRRSGELDFGRDWLTGALALLGAMLCTTLLMVPVAWVYQTIHGGDEHDHSLDETTLVLPAVVAGIVLIVQHSLALAFSLAGIVAGVRFRRALTDTFDTLFILTAIGVGIAAGTRSLEIAVVLSVFFNYSTLVVNVFSDGLESRFLARKRFRKQQLKAQAAAEGTRDTLS